VNEQDRSDQAGGGAVPTPPDQQQNHPKTCCDRAREYGHRFEAFVERHARTIEVVAVAIGTAFTVALCFVAYWQWQTSQQATKAAETANRVATAAIKSSREMTEAIERPWVLFDAQPIDDPLTADKEKNWATQEGFGIFVRNFGRVPAFDIRWATWSGQPDELQSDTIPATGWVWTLRGMLLAPGDALQATRFWNWDREPISHDLGTAMVGLVSVNYIDQFQRPHSTLFCVTLQLGNSPYAVRPCYGIGDAD